MKYRIFKIVLSGMFLNTFVQPLIKLKENKTYWVPETKDKNGKTDNKGTDIVKDLVYLGSVI